MTVTHRGFTLEATMPESADHVSYCATRKADGLVVLEGNDCDDVPETIALLKVDIDDLIASKGRSCCIHPSIWNQVPKTQYAN
jgi:hypothetical protein